MMNDYPYTAAQSLLGSQQCNPLSNQYQNQYQAAANGGLLSKIGNAAQGAPLGSILRIRLPEPVAEAAPLMRYNFLEDKMVPVTQEWVNDILDEVKDKHLQLDAAHKEIQRLTILQSFQPEPVVEKSEQDHIWQALRMAAGG